MKASFYNDIIKTIVIIFLINLLSVLTWNALNTNILNELEYLNKKDISYLSKYSDNPDQILSVKNANYENVTISIINNKVDIIESETLTCIKKVNLFILLFSLFNFISSVIFLLFQLRRYKKEFQNLEDMIETSTFHTFNYQEFNSVRDKVEQNLDTIDAKILQEKNKARFISHELKNPLQVIKGYNQLNKQLKKNDYHSEINSEITKIDSIIESTLYQHHNCQTFNLSEYFDGIDLQIESDKIKHDQIITNLMNNAMRYKLSYFKVELTKTTLIMENDINNELSNTQLGLKIVSLNCSDLQIGYKTYIKDNIYITELEYLKIIVLN